MENSGLAMRDYSNDTINYFSNPQSTKQKFCGYTNTGTYIQMRSENTTAPAAQLFAVMHSAIM